MNTNQHTSAKGLNYFISVKLLILGTNVSQRPWVEVKSNRLHAWWTSYRLNWDTSFNFKRSHHVVICSCVNREWAPKAQKKLVSLIGKLQPGADLTLTALFNINFNREATIKVSFIQPFLCNKWNHLQTSFFAVGYLNYLHWPVTCFNFNIQQTIIFH